MESKKSSPLKTSKKDEDVPAPVDVSRDLQKGDLKVGVNEDDVDRVLEKDVESKEIPPPSSVKPWDTPGYCRKCLIRLNFEEDGRGGMWYGRDGNVWVDGCGLCIDCELDGSVETDPNWGKSTRSSDEEDCSSSDGVSSSTPLKKRFKRKQ